MNLDNNSMSKFSNDGTLLAATVGTFSQNPEACLIVDADTMFTGQVRGTGGLLKLDLAGNQLAKYGSMRTDWIDLAADHCSMYYSDEGPAIHRYDVCTNKPLTDFVANLGVHIYALRILPNQTVLAATGAGVQLFDASGKQLSLYPKTGFLGDPFALNLDPDGVSFWTAALAGHTIFKFAIAPAGPPILTFDAQVAAGGGTGVAGLGVFGERVVGQVLGPVSTASDIGPLVLVGLLVLLVLILVVVALVISRRRRGDAPPA